MEAKPRMNAQAHDPSQRTAKEAVREFWNEASCGEDLYLPGTAAADYEAQARARYALEPYIEPFADFAAMRGREVLEIGVGLGADHQRFAQAGAVLTGVDLTERAIEHTRRRLAALGLQSTLSTADAEALPFGDGSFDVVYSWGVLHHSPNTPRAISEVHRVLRPGGEARIMIYHKWSLVGAMLWIRYGLLRGRPWTSLKEIYHRWLESPGTKAYSIDEAREMFLGWQDVRINTVLTHADLLESAAGQRHEGRPLRIMRALWPRRLLAALFPRAGLFMLIRARR